MKLSTCSLLFVCSVLLSVDLFGQTGAAGVGNASTLPMWFDANTLGLTDGSQVSQFTDISGNSNHLTQSTSTRRPVFTAAGLNGLPVITFDGVNDFLSRGATSGLETTELTWFIVYKRNLLEDQSLINAGYSSEVSKWGTYSTPANNRLVSIHRSPTAKTVYFDDAGAPSFMSSHITPTQFRTYEKGVLKMTLNTTYTAGAGHNLLRVGAYNYNLTGYFLNGFIAEIIVYNSALTNLERIMVENYLGAKYNLAIPTDLYAYQASHNIGLIGIGNNGSNSQSTAQGAGVVEFSAPADLGTDEYLLAAHTNDNLASYTTTDLPGSLTGYQRWTRTWRVDETGDVGSMTIRFYLSGISFGSTSSYRLLVDNDGNFTDATVVTGTYDSGTQSVTFSADLSDGQYFTLSAATQSLVINSVQSNVWSDPNTWDCTCVPTLLDEVHISPFNTVTVDANAETGYLIVEPNGTLEMTSAVNLDIYNDFDIIGSINFTDGMVAMVGSGDQYVDAGGSTVAFHDLEIDNSGGVVTFYTSEYLINGTLFPTNGTLTVDPDPANLFVINSTSATTTGRIAPVGVSFTFNGDFTVRRFLPAGNADYRDLASPVTGATLSQWDTDLFISGTGFPDGCAYGDGGCFYSVQYYDISTAYNVTDINHVLGTGTGYEVFTGDDLTTFSGATLSSTGTLNDGQDVVISCSSNYSTKGNPYACPIDWDLIGLSGVGDYFYVYDASTGAYQWYDGASGTASVPSLSGGIIDIGQGIWVVGPGTMTVTDGSKTTADATFIKANEPVDYALNILLREDQSTYNSSMALQEAIDANDDFEFLTDISHFSTGLEKAPTIAMYSQDELIRKNYIRKDLRNKSFNLYTKILNPGYYTLESSNIENFSHYRSILIYDQHTGEWIDLKKEGAYHFYSDVFEGHRFTLILSNEEGATESTVQSLTINESDFTDGITIEQMGHTFSIVSTTDLPENSTIKLINILGQNEVFMRSVTLIEGKTLITVPEELSGVHLFVISTGDQIITKKVVL